MATKPMQIIYLNGPSSSGKTMLAKALQDAFEEPFLHLSIDKIIGWMPKKVNDWTGGQASLGYKWVEYYKEQQQHIRTVYLLEEQGAILGYASLLRESHYLKFKEIGIPEINDVWVSADHRGNGLGSRLIQHVEKMALKQGLKQIGLGVGLYKDYGSAQKLYIHLGYIPDGMGVTYKSQLVVPGNSHPVDDDLLIWLKRDLE